MTLSRLWLCVAITLPAVVALLVPLPAVDLAYQLRAGDEILRTGAIPASDSWTFTAAGAAWVDQQWLAQVLLALAHRIGGWELLAVLRAALVACAFGLVAAVALARGTGPRVAAILSLVAFLLAAPALALRPQLFGIVLFAGLLLLVARRHDSPRAAWLAPLLVVAWANVHGSFVLAPVLLGYAWLDDVARGRSARASLAILAAGTAATLVNPFGPAVWAYAAGIGTNATIAGQATEWQRTTPFTLPGLLFYVSAVAVLALAVRGRAALRAPDWLWLVGLFAIGVYAVRGLAWWPLGLVLVLVTLVTVASPERSVPGTAPRPGRAGRFNAVVAAVLGLIVVAALPWWRAADPVTGRVGLLTYAPSGLAAALRLNATPGARVFAPQMWTSWFEWAVPDARYFVDSRFELVPETAWRDYDAVARGLPDASGALDRWGITILVVPTGGTGPAQGATGRWAVVFQDADGAIYQRSAP